MRYLIRIGR